MNGTEELTVASRGSVFRFVVERLGPGDHRVYVQHLPPGAPSPGLRIDQDGRRYLHGDCPLATARQARRWAQHWADVVSEPLRRPEE